MDQAINPSQIQILDRIADSKEKVKLSLRQKFQNIKLETIKDSLKENNINVSENISSIKELKKVLKEQLDDISFSQVETIIDEVSAAYNEMLVNLENGSMDALSKFLSKADKILKPMAKVAGKSLASRTALILAPTIASKIVIAGGLAAGSIYKLVKNKKEGKVVNQDVECDKILQELEITRNNGVITDTRFNEEIQKEVRKFLNSKNIEFTDTGYLSLREVIYSLSYENKKELCNLINSRLGRGINVEERLNAKKGGFFDNLKDSIKQIAKPAAAGIGVAAAVNTIDPALIAGPLNGTTIGKFVESLVKSKLFGTTVGVASGLLTKILEIIPGIGKIAESIFSAENLIVGAVVGTGVGVAGMVATNIFNIIKGFSEKFKYSKDWKNIQKFDATKYNDDNAKELEAMKKMVNEHENTKSEQMLFDFVYEYFVEELNITFDEKPKNLTQLSEALSKLDEKDKKRATKFLDKLMDYNSNNHSDFVNALIKGGKVASTLAIAGLAGLSIYDILRGGEFLPELSGKLFKNVDGNIYTAIQEKEQIDRIDYRDNVPNTENKVSMISDKDQAQTVDHYNNLDQMIKEGNDFAKARDGIRYRVEDVSNRGSDFFNQLMTSPLETITETIPKSIKATWSDITEWLSNIPSQFEKDFSNIDLNLFESKTYADEKAINDYINGLSDEELLNVAYYYNKSSAVNPNSVAFKDIGQVLAKPNNLLRIQNAINSYNEKMKMIRDVNKIISNGGTVLPAIAEVDEQIKKNIN